LNIIGDVLVAQQEDRMFLECSVHRRIGGIVGRGIGFAVSKRCSRGD